MEFDDYWIFNNLRIFKVHKLSYPPIHMVYYKETEEYKSLDAREIYTLLRNSDINKPLLLGVVIFTSSFFDSIHSKSFF